MRSEREFEALVFERAEEIKARDRSRRLVRMSVMPIAAALVVLTAVGIRGILSVPNGTANSFDAAVGEYAGDTQQKTAGAPAVNSEQNAAEQYKYENEDIDYAAQMQGDAAFDEGYDNAPAAAAEEDSTRSADVQMTAVIMAQSRITVSGEAAVALYDALSGSSDAQTEPTAGCLGTVEFSDGMMYRIFKGSAEEYIDGTPVRSIVIDESTAEMLANYGIEQ